MKVLVIGDSCTDRFIYGSCERMCPEGPVPILSPTSIVNSGGMAKNVQSNIQALGVQCDIITNNNNILKTRYVDRKTNQMLLRVDENDFTETRFNIKDVTFSSYNAVVISDYNKGFLNHENINHICLNHDNVFLDTKRRVEYDLPKTLKYIKINQYEYQENKPLRSLFPDKLIVTYGSAGCMYKHKMIPPPEKVEARDLSGAGDTFLAGFVVSLLKDNDIYKSIDFAQECAGVVVSKRGVATINGISE